MKPFDDRPHDDDEDFGPSRSEKRRNALDILKLAGQLVELPPSRIPKLNLPEDIVDEIGRTRKVTSHIARKRQLAFLAKQMRRHGDEAFVDARAALGEDRDRQRQEAAHMHCSTAIRTSTASTCARWYARPRPSATRTSRCMRSGRSTAS